MSPGRVIVLNGASSSGKTSILRALQDALPEPYLDAGLDKFLSMLPRRYLQPPLWDDVLGLADQAGDAGHRLVFAMHRAVAMLAHSGANLLIDHVLLDSAWACDLAVQLDGLDAALIGVRCPLDVLVERENARRERTPGQAALQHELVHDHGPYDFEVDTSLHTAAHCAASIRRWLDAGHPLTAFERLRC